MTLLATDQSITLKSADRSPRAMYSRVTGDNIERFKPRGP